MFFHTAAFFRATVDFFTLQLISRLVAKKFLSGSYAPDYAYEGRGEGVFTLIMLAYIGGRGVKIVKKLIT